MYNEIQRECRLYFVKKLLEKWLDSMDGKVPGQFKSKDLDFVFHGQNRQIQWKVLYAKPRMDKRAWKKFLDEFQEETNILVKKVIGDWKNECNRYWQEYQELQIELQRSRERALQTGLLMPSDEMEMQKKESKLTRLEYAYNFMMMMWGCGIMVSNVTKSGEYLIFDFYTVPNSGQS